MRMRRRDFLFGGGAIVALAAATPVALGGMTSFLRRTLSDHFGPDVLALEGIDDFVSEFAALSGGDDPVKRVVAEVYFAWRGDRVHMIGPATALRDRFLRTILTRSNIIAIQQARETEFEFGSVDPWIPDCGYYLSVAADETV